MGQDFPWVFRLSRSARNFYLIIGWLVIGLGVALAIGIGETLVSLFALLGCGLLGAPVIGAAYRTRVVITEDAIEARELFRVKSMRRADIAGFRIVQGDGARVRLESGGTRVPALTLPAFIAYDSRIDEWLSGAVNYDQQERQASLDSVLASPELAGSTEERFDALQRAQRVARIVTLSTLVLSLWALFYPRPYDLLLVMVTLCPWIAVGIAMSSTALYRVNPLRNDMGADLSFAIIMPVAPLVMRGIFVANVLDGWTLFFLSLGGCLLLTALLCVLMRELRRTGAVLTFGFFMAGYAYGVISVANVRFDHRDPVPYAAKVLDMSAVGSNNREYRLHVGPWGPRAGADDVNVSRELYEGVSKGDKVCVYLWPGALRVRWYWVGKCGQ